MFERFTEGARRVIFFGRFEAAESGSAFVETEHLLLGALRQDNELALRLLGSEAAIAALRERISPPRTGNRVSSSVDLPLNPESKRVLAYAAEESQRLGHRHIEIEHLLLGMLREESSRAAQALRAASLDPSRLLEQLARHAVAPTVEAEQPFAPMERLVTKEDLHRLIDELNPNLWTAAAKALQAVERRGSVIIARGRATAAGASESNMSDLLERFTEQARRSIFFARCEASSSGSSTIESEHLLLGLLREHEPLVHRLRLEGVAEIQREIERKKPDPPDLALSSQCVRAITLAAQEASRLNHKQVANEHLLSGLLLVDDCLGGELLRKQGIEVEQARRDLEEGKL